MDENITAIQELVDIYRVPSGIWAHIDEYAAAKVREARMKDVERVRKAMSGFGTEQEFASDAAHEELDAIEKEADGRS